MTRVQRYFGIIFVSIVLILLIIRLTMPYVIKGYINRQLDKTPEYTGEVADVSLHLLTGRVVLSNIELESQQNPNMKFALAVKHLYMDVNYLQLLQGKAAMDVIADQPVLQLFQLKPVAAVQVEEPKKPTDIWQIGRSMLLPVPVNEVTVHQGTVYYIDQTQSDTTKPGLQATQIEAVATHLHEEATDKQPLPAYLMINADTTGQGIGQLKVEFNPWAKLPAFNLSAKLEHVNLSQINFLLQSHTDLRVQQGGFNFYMEASAQNGKITGYAKPFFENLKVTLPPSKQGNPIKQMYKKIVNWLSDVFTNEETGKDATKIEFSGTINDPDSSLWSVIGNLIENAFFKALVPGLESSDH